MFIFKIILFILEIVLLINLMELIVLERKGDKDLYKEKVHKFYKNYVVNNTLFPIEYRSDIKYVPKIIKTIKENPKKYEKIPMDDVLNLDTLMRFENSNEYLKKKYEKSAIFIAMTLSAYVIQMYLISKYPLSALSL